MEREKEKSSLRRRILTLRRAQSRCDIEKKSAEIQGELSVFIPFCQAGTILFYLATKDEVQTGEIIEESLNGGKRVIVPFIDWRKREILPSEIKDPARDIEIGVFDIPQPKRDSYCPFSPVDIDIVIAPGVAFDRKGNRIGFGGGFYDRFLSELSDGVAVIALAFELQLVDAIPVQSHDVAVDYLITERGITDCRHSE